MAVDVIAEKRRAVLGHLSQTSVRQESRLDEGLESVADSQNKSSPVYQGMHSIGYILIVQHIRNEFSASVRLISGRESTAEHKHMTLVYVLLHLCD